MVDFVTAQKVVGAALHRVATAKPKRRKLEPSTMDVEIAVGIKLEARQMGEILAFGNLLNALEGFFDTQTVVA